MFTSLINDKRKEKKNFTLFVYFNLIVAIICFSHCMLNIGGSRILAIETIAGKSHWNFMRSILRTLSERGHQVTVFTPFPDGNRPNYTEIDLSFEVPIKVGMNVQDMLQIFSTSTGFLPVLLNMTRYTCEIIYQNVYMEEILNKSHKFNFDLVITEPMCSSCVDYTAAKLKLPMIYLIPSPMITYKEREFYGHIPNLATTSHVMARYARPRTFWERFSNVKLHLEILYALATNEKKLKNLYPANFDYIDSIRSSLTFINTHYITEAPNSLPLDVVQVGGIHLSIPKPIPNDILEFIENSPHGVILFTFGSVATMSTLPDHIQNAFKKAVARLPQRVLWKYECEMEDKPDNVMTKKWFPQRDILLHPKVKLFISHGGISGVYETVDAGVPVLGFPLFYDQPRNIENLVEAGMAMSMDLVTVTEESFFKSVMELINNNRYTENAKIASERFKDRPMSPADLVVYWTEYVIRHKGAPHLKSPALELTWYQYYLMDVMGAIILGILIALFIISKTLRIIRSLLLKNLINSKKKSE